jgi:AcrR family transcriptional regulator
LTELQRVAKIVRVVDLREAGKNRRRRQILDAARGLIEAHGRETLSMRRLAERAQLSTRTLYNLYGAKEDILYALMEENLRDVDSALVRLALTDPLDRSRALISVAIDQFCARTALNRALIRGVEIGQGPRDTELVSLTRARHQAVIEAAMEQGMLERKVSPRLLAHHIVMAYGQALRLWSREVLDSTQLKAQALHARALYLLSVVAPSSRARLEREVTLLETDLQGLVQLFDDLATPLAPAPRDRKRATV